MDRDKSSLRLTVDTELRQQAEERLQGESTKQKPPHTMEDLQKIVHELEVHQIELDMQNSELRQTRHELETVLDKYADLYEFAPVGYFTLDRNGAISAANLNAAGLLGVDRSFLIGRQFIEFIAEDVRPEFTFFLQNVYSCLTKEVCDLAIHINDSCRIAVRIEAAAAADGRECRIACIDITELKRTEATLRKREYQLAEAQRLVHLGSWQWDAIDDNITGSDEFYQIFGLFFTTYEAFLKQVHPEDQAKVHKAVQGTLNRREPYGVFYRIIRPDNALRTIHAQGESIVDSSGTVIRMIGTAQDVTERVLLEQKLEILHSDLSVRAAEQEAANIELEAFNYSVSHDLRSPLTAINGYCQMIQTLSCSILEKQCTKYLWEISNGAQRMNNLIETMLNFSSVKQAPLFRASFDMSAMAKSVAEELQMAAPERRIIFRIADGITANGDVGLWRIALDNLIGNAWKYTVGRGQTVIEFGTSEIEGNNVYYVRDNGPGFDMAYAGKLFDPFQRVPGIGIDGHGIGLATVERIVTRHGGRVWAESEPDKTTTFWFTME